MKKRKRISDRHGKIMANALFTDEHERQRSVFLRLISDINNYYQALETGEKPVDTNQSTIYEQLENFDKKDGYNLACKFDDECTEPCQDADGSNG